MALEWTEHDGAFFDGVFGDSPAPEGLVMAWENDELSKPPPSGDAASPSNVIKESIDVKEASETAIASTTKLSTGLTTTKANDNDVLCVRGSGHGSHPGNKYFRELIKTNVTRFSTMTTSDEKLVLSTQLWEKLHNERGCRFLRATEDPSVYSIIDHEQSIKKILFALRDCKCYNANKAKGGKKKKATGKKQVRVTISSAEEERILFESKVDDELSKLYVNDTVLKAMTQSWKDDFDEKKSLFEEQLIARYRVAAERGISPEQFTDRFLKALLKEIRGVSRNE